MHLWGNLYSIFTLWHGQCHNLQYLLDNLMFIRERNTHNLMPLINCAFSKELFGDTRLSARISA